MAVVKADGYNHGGAAVAAAALAAGAREVGVTTIEEALQRRRAQVCRVYRRGVTAFVVPAAERVLVLGVIEGAAGISGHESTAAAPAAIGPNLEVHCNAP
ncbi:alanine racemase [Nocardia sp. NPDC059091]|uniref:alanine racemase n=1 Tax=Nocardia sp. NPDC059091 TaxID=3346724 RepID=UPI0036B50E20